MIPAGRLACAAALAAALLTACGSPERRLEAALTLRHQGDARRALDACRALLADLGEGTLGGADAAVRGRTLRLAADLASLELGDLPAALAYYRRIVSLEPGAPAALEARVRLGDLYRDRLGDPLAAIAQYADVAASGAPGAPRCQLEVARGYLALRRFDQARTEARLLRERWPDHPLAAEAQLLVGQAFALERRDDEALGALQALVDRRGAAPDAVARAREAQAALHAQHGRFDRAVELYRAALPGHPNPTALHDHIDAVRARQARAGGARPGALDEHLR